MAPFRTGAPQPQSGRAGVAAVDDLVEQWVRSLEYDGSPVPPAPPSDGGSNRPVSRAPAAAARVPPEVQPAHRIDGNLVTLADAPHAPVAILQRGSRVLHLGTVAVCGEAAPAKETYIALGLSEVEADALRFVASWFGAPFDALNVRRRGTHPLSFGFWHLAGDAVPECLLAWKTRAAEDFTRKVAAQGIDVLAPDASQPPRLVAKLEGEDGVLGEAAADAIACDARLAAVLVRAGREREGQLAQIETVLRRSVRPALSIPVERNGSQAKLGDVLQSRRAVAVVLHAELFFGAKGPSRLAAVLTKEGLPQEPGIEPRLEAFVEDLHRSGCAREADQALRILTSPELA